MRFGNQEDKFGGFDEMNKNDHENEVEMSDTESFGLIDEEFKETIVKANIQTETETETETDLFVKNESVDKDHPCVQNRENDISAILDKECEHEEKVFRNFLLPPLLLDLKIVSKTSELPLASAVQDWAKELFAPVQDLVDTSVLPLAERLLKAVDENLVSQLSEETVSWISRTKAQMVTIVQKSDDVACGCLDAFTLQTRSVNRKDKQVKQSDEALLDNALDYISTFKVVQFGIELFNLWIAFIVLFSMFGFFTMMALFAPFSMAALFVMIASVVFMCLLCIFPVMIFFAVPMIIFATISSFFYILLY